MVHNPVPSREQLVERARQLAPLLQKHSAWAEENRRPHDEAIEALADAGIFKMRVPARYGGFESDTRTLVDVAAELGRGDPSVSWVESVYTIPTWMAGLFPDEVQDEVFGTPDVRVCGTLSPSAMAAPADGGIVVNGKWGFISGAPHAHWQEIVAVLVGPDGPPMPVVALVPMADLQIIDDWHTSGMRGTGSVSTVAKDLFVPQARVLPLPAVLEGQSASAAGGDAAQFRAPLLPVASASSVGTLIGIAKGARDALLERLRDSKITYTGYDRQADAPLTHLQVAEVTMKIDEAEFHAHRMAGLVDSKCAEGSPWTLLERVQTRGDVGAIGRLTREAVDICMAAGGGSAIYEEAPLQRFHRDVSAANQHALMNPNTNAELYGRVLCGLEPNSQYV